MIIGAAHGTVAAGQPASDWPRVSTLTTYTSPLPPHTWVPGRSNQHSSHADGQPARAYNLFVLYIYPLIALIKPVFTEPQSVTVPVLFGTCTVLVGTVESIPVPPQYIILYYLLYVVC